jgi:hypothetical protein
LVKNSETEISRCFLASDSALWRLPLLAGRPFFEGAATAAGCVASGSGVAGSGTLGAGDGVGFFAPRATRPLARSGFGASCFFLPAFFEAALDFTGVPGAWLRPAAKRSIWTTFPSPARPVRAAFFGAFARGTLRARVTRRAVARFAISLLSTPKEAWILAFHRAK